MVSITRSCATVTPASRRCLNEAIGAEVVVVLQEAPALAANAVIALSQSRRSSSRAFISRLPDRPEMQLGIGGLIDLSHATLANKGSYVVMAESGADL
jgi:hypothetical protein